MQQTLELDPAIQAVEVKITAQIQDEDAVREALARSGEVYEERQVYFFDTDDLVLFDRGIVLRARKVSDDTDDSTVKLRPVDPTTLSGAWKETEGFEVELDGVGDATICSAKLSADQDRDEIDAVATGGREIKKLSAGPQERLLEEHAPADISWDDLTVLGPVDVQKWMIDPKGYGEEVVAEEWTLPDGSDLIELSITIEPERAEDASNEFMAYLEEHGFTTEGDQQTKTRATLNYSTGGSGFA